MIPQRVKKAITDNPKKLATLIDLVNVPHPIKEFLGQAQCSQLGCFRRVWSYIKENNLQIDVVTPEILRGTGSAMEIMLNTADCDCGGARDHFAIPQSNYANIYDGAQRTDPKNKNIVNCDAKLKSVLLGTAQVDLAELPMLVKLHFPKQQK